MNRRSYLVTLIELAIRESQRLRGTRWEDPVIWQAVAEFEKVKCSLLSGSMCYDEVSVPDLAVLLFDRGIPRDIYRFYGGAYRYFSERIRPEPYSDSKLAENLSAVADEAEKWIDESPYSDMA